MNDLVEQLEKDYEAKIALHAATGRVSFLRFPAVSALPLIGNSRQEKVYAFISEYRQLWNIQNPFQELRFKEEKADAANHHHLIFEQLSNGVPVFDGNLRFHFDEKNDLLSVNGIFLPEVTVSPMAQIAANEATFLAMEEMKKQWPDRAELFLEIENNRLVYFQKALAEGKPKGKVHLVYEIDLTNRQDIRETVFIDAHTGELVTQYTRHCTAVARRVFEGNTNNQVWEEGTAFPGTLDIWQQNAVTVTGQVYDLFTNTFNYRSYDDAEAEMQCITNASFLDCPNANWNGETTNYCDSLAVDDVIAHEWGHAYTEYTNDLIYKWQAGAINEAYSDIWGETIDLINNYGLDTNQHLLRTACESGIRWKIGEEVGGFPDPPIRDMWNPNCNGHPGSITDTLYHCELTDNGGVHRNSGIPNHAYALLVDGGSFNGQNITGIGLTKAAHIFWHAQKYYLTRTSDFAALASALEASCTDLWETAVRVLTFEDSGFSTETITSFDSLQLANAIKAVEMRGEIPCQFAAMFEEDISDLCDPVSEDFVKIFEADFETGNNGWETVALPSNVATWTPRNWSLTNNLPDDRAGSAMYAPNSHIGDCDADLENGMLRMQSPIILIPANITSDLYLRFDHYLSTENKYDGGNLKYKLNSNSWTILPKNVFLDNEYTSVLHNFPISDNPLRGEPAFTGTSVGSETGNWGTSQVRLSSLGITAGDTLQLRWEFGENACAGWDGWYVDNVEIGHCALAALPVSWLSFTVQPKDDFLLLEWETALEENNTGFEVQRNEAGETSFETIAWIAAGDGNYSFQDKNIRPNILYLYRLRQIDQDGAFSYSVIRRGKLERKKRKDFEIIPNPANESSRLYFSEELRGKGALFVFDASGKQLLQEKIALDEEFYQLPALFPGAYWVTIRTASQNFVKRLIIL